MKIVMVANKKMMVFDLQDVPLQRFLNFSKHQTVGVEKFHLLSLKVLPELENLIDVR